MGFGRHRERELTQEKKTELFQKKIHSDLSEFAKDLQKEIDKNGGELPGTKIEPEEAEIKTPSRSKSRLSKIIRGEKELEPIRKDKVRKLKKARVKKTRKKRENDKERVALGLIGDTIEARDFRAIVKKKNLQINNVLNKILHEWNTANYNL